MCEGGFTGADCMVDPCPNNCNNHGVCTETTDGLGKVCKCTAGYTGADCLECDAVYHCNTHGTCLFDQGAAVCSCFAGFSTDDCSMAACPIGINSAQQSSVCSGQGTCSRDDASGQYACKCEIHDGVAFGTVDCHATCPHTKHGLCGGHGYCADSNDVGEEGYGEGQCVCQDGWTGEGCTDSACMRSIPIGGAVNDDTTPSNQTTSSSKRSCGGLGQGTCVKGVCYCRAGFAPPSCSSFECPNDCSGLGVCMEAGKCACDSGFGGDDCSEPACCDRNCNGHGECKLGRCHCEGKHLFFVSIFSH